LYIDAVPTIVVLTAARSTAQERSAQIFDRAIATEEQREMTPTPQIAVLKRSTIWILLD
jgi:hypothetical protein